MVGPVLSSNRAIGAHEAFDAAPLPEIPPVNARSSLRRLQWIYGLAFAALVLVAGIAGALGLVTMSRTAQEAQRIGKLLEIVETTRGDLNRQIKEVSDYHFLPDPDAKQQFEAYGETIEANFVALAALALTTDERAAVDRLTEAYLAARSHTLRLMDAAPGSIPEADRLKMFDTELESSHMDATEDAFSAAEELLVVGRLQLDERTTAMVRIALIVIVVPVALSAALLLVARLYLQSAFVAPLHDVLAAMEMYRAGNLEFRVRERGAAEMVDLQHSINRMAGDLEQSREALVRTEKQAALGALVPVIAHNIRNPLASIRAIAQVSQDASLPTETREALTSIVGTVDRLNHWLTALLSYLNPLEVRRAPAKLSDCVDHALVLMAPKLAEKDIAVKQRDWPSTKQTELDVELMEQAVYGLLANAFDASPAEGRLTLRAGAANGSNWITIEDQGPGFPFAPDTNGVFPGPTTKTRGSGLGIPFAAKICELHGGDLKFDKAPGGGARVTVSVPTHTASE